MARVPAGPGVTGRGASDAHGRSIVPELSVVVPFHNEAESVRPLIAEIYAALVGHPAFELICVDDGSADDTFDRLRALQSAHTRLRLFRHRHRCGQSTAVRTGVKRSRAPWIVTLDGDGQNDPADIPLLLAVVADPACPPDLQLVIGMRQTRRDDLIKRVSSRVANRVRATILQDNTPDSGCGLKLFRRDAFLDLPYYDHMHRFLPALVLREGGRVVSVPVTDRQRAHGRSKYGLQNRLWVGIDDLLGVMWLRRRPLSVKGPQARHGEES